MTKLTPASPLAGPRASTHSRKTEELFSPTRILPEIGIQSNLAARYRVEIMLVLIISDTVLTIKIAVGCELYLCQIGRRLVSQIGTNCYIRMLAVVEQVKLMPTDKVPIADIVVEH